MSPAAGCRRAVIRAATAMLPAVFALAAAPARAADAPHTMRLDYFHTGTATEERFSPDRVVIEPLPWPGNPDRPIDGTDDRTSLVQAGLIDSLAVLQIVSYLEATYGLDFRLLFITASYAMYTEELGAYAGQDKDKRQLVTLNIGW